VEEYDDDFKGSDPWVIEVLIDQTMNQLLDFGFRPEEQDNLLGQLSGLLTVLEHWRLTDEEAWRLAAKYEELPEIISVFDNAGIATQAAYLITNLKFQDTGIHNHIH
jgi:hypothetical protein